MIIVYVDIIGSIRFKMIDRGCCVDTELMPRAVCWAELSAMRLKSQIHKIIGSLWDLTF